MPLCQQPLCVCVSACIDEQSVFKGLNTKITHYLGALILSHLKYAVLYLRMRYTLSFRLGLCKYM